MTLAELCHALSHNLKRQGASAIFRKVNASALDEGRYAERGQQKHQVGLIRSIVHFKKNNLLERLYEDQ
jgi:hypothetical protein